MQELEAVFWIIVGSAMFGFAIFFGELVSGQIKFKKKPNELS